MCDLWFYLLVSYFSYRDLIQLSMRKQSMSKFWYVFRSRHQLCLYL